MHIEFGVSRQIVSRWENGDAIPRATKVKTICDEFNISPEMLLRNEEEIKDNNYNLKETKKEKSKNIKTKIIIMLLIVVALYLGYSIYKIVLITKIYSNIKEYDKWGNYYAKIEKYEDAKQISSMEIWYKDSIYKIKSENYTNNGDKSEDLRIINVNNNTRTELVNGEIKQYDDEYMDDIFNQRNYLTTYYPWIYDYKKNKIKAWMVNIITASKENNTIKIKNGKKILYLKNDWTIPISYSDSDKEKITFISFDIQKNVVKDEDLIIKKDL